MQSVFAKQSLVKCRVPHHHRGKNRVVQLLVSLQWTPVALLQYDINRTTPGKRLCLGKMLNIQFFNPQPRNPLLIAQFVVLSFFIEDSAIWFLSCPFALELYYSLHSFCIFWSVFFFVCTFTNCLSLFSLPLCVMLSWKNKQKKNLPEKQFYSMNIKPRLEDPINLFHYLQHLSFFFYDHCVRAYLCVCVCVCVFLLQATHKKMCILVLLKMFRCTWCVFVCVSAKTFN